MVFVWRLEQALADPRGSNSAMALSWFLGRAWPPPQTAEVIVK